MNKDFTFKNGKVFDILKWLAILALPALGWFYGEIGPAWNLPYVAEVTLTLDRLGILLGILLGISNHNYNKRNGGVSIQKLADDEIAEDAKRYINGL